MLITSNTVLRLLRQVRYCASFFDLKFLLFSDFRIIHDAMTYDNWYFQLVEPDEISYTYKIRPAKDFGMLLVGFKCEPLELWYAFGRI